MCIMHVLMRQCIYCSRYIVTYVIYASVRIGRACDFEFQCLASSKLDTYNSYVLEVVVSLDSPCFVLNSILNRLI